MEEAVSVGHKGHVIRVTKLGRGRLAGATKRGELSRGLGWSFLAGDSRAGEIRPRPVWLIAHVER